jgi:hypothetical protein
VPFVSRGTRLSAKLENSTLVPSADRAGEPSKEKELPFPGILCAFELARAMAPVSRFLTKTSMALLVSPGTRLVAALQNATICPSADREPALDRSLASVPSAAVLALIVWPDARSLTKTSTVPLLSSGTRLEPADPKARRLPFADREGNSSGGALDCDPSDAVSPRTTAPVIRSLT